MIKRETKGITLIALVVTIIVLLILAGITISLVFSENGIISKAREAAEKSNQSVINEMQELNNLVDEIQNAIGNEEKNEIVVLERNEDSIKVKAKEGLIDYQFSLDAINWSNTQSSPEYTFTDLEKVYFEPKIGEEYNSIPSGNKYTIYAKAKKQDGEEVNLGVIQTSNVIEIISAFELWEYEDLGNEIMITGIRPLYELYDYYKDKGIEMLEMPKIEMAIPSYINNKPVTKINYSLWSDMEKKTSSMVEVFLENLETGVMNSITTEINSNGDLSFWNPTLGNYKIYALADTAIGSSDEFEVKSSSVENPDDKEYIYVETDLMLSLIDKYNIIIPPTVKKMVNDNNMISYILKQRRYAAMEKMEISELPEKIEFVELVAHIDLEQQGQSNKNTGRIRICGKENLNEIVNSDLLKTWYESYGNYKGWEFIN